MEIKSSAIGTTFTILGVLNSLVGFFGLILMMSDKSEEMSKGIILSISCFSGMLVCFAVASALHFLCQIAHRLELLQGILAPAATLGTSMIQPNQPAPIAITPSEGADPHQP